MRSFLKALLFFAIPLIVANLFFFKLVNAAYYQPYFDHPGSEKFKTFIFADSHGLPLSNLLEKSGIYNFSAPSDNYLDILRKITYLINNKNIDKVILIADGHTLSRYKENNNNEDRSIHYSDYKSFIDLNEDLGSLHYFKEKYIAYYIPFFSPKSRDILYGIFLKFLGSSEKSKVESFDWKKSKNKVELAEARVEYQFPDSVRSIILTQLLLEIVKLCDQNKIELIGLKFPMTNEYINASTGRNFSTDSILISHKIRVLDFETSFIKQDSLFVNQDHINNAGGEIMSKKIIESLKK